MDQFASVMGKKDRALLLDCRSLEHQEVPLNIEPYQIVLLNTKVSHNLASSEYNTRKNECEQGVAIIRMKYPQVRSLRDVDANMLESVRENMDATVFKRCSFIIAAKHQGTQNGGGFKKAKIYLK